MNRPTLLLLVGLLGCAPKVPLELANARLAYEQARAGSAVELVPAELHQAKQALTLAEAAFQDDPKGFHTLDLAYVAQRKAELVEALVATATQKGNTTDANDQYQAIQDTIMTETRADLAVSETARSTAEEEASKARAALAKLTAVREESRGMVITLSGSVFFRTNDATLLPSAQARLGEVTQALLMTKERSLLVEGHTDSQGSDAYNLELSQKRAEAVRTYISQHGYDAALIRAVGIGEARPVADNSSAEGRSNNRRVEIVVVPAAVSTQ